MTHLFMVFAPCGTLFPIDMLRLDRCWPATNKSAGNVETALRPLNERRTMQRPEFMRIHLEGLQAPSVELWNRFGWAVDFHHDPVKHPIVEMGPLIQDNQSSPDDPEFDETPGTKAVFYGDAAA